jgi:hypothetical protein
MTAETQQWELAKYDGDDGWMDCGTYDSLEAAEAAIPEHGEGAYATGHAADDGRYLYQYHCDGTRVWHTDLAT